MNGRMVLVGEDWRRPTSILAVSGLLVMVIRFWATADPSFRFWPPSSLVGVPYIGFVPWIILFATATALSYRNDGWSVAVGLVYCGFLAIPPGAYVLSPESLTQRLIAEFWWPLPFSVVTGTGCFLLGGVLRLLPVRFRWPKQIFSH